MPAAEDGGADVSSCERRADVSSCEQRADVSSCEQRADADGVAELPLAATGVTGSSANSCGRRGSYDLDQLETEDTKPAVP